MKIRAAIIGYGNIGKFTLEALEAAPDFEVAGIVRRDPSKRDGIPAEIPVVGSIKELEKVDVAILATPTREVEKHAVEILNLGINTVDSFDTHAKIAEYKQYLNKSKTNNLSIIATGWDPDC